MTRQQGEWIEDDNSPSDLRRGRLAAALPGKGLDEAAEQDFRKALEIGGSLRTMIEAESNKIREKRKARQKP